MQIQEKQINFRYKWLIHSAAGENSEIKRMFTFELKLRKSFKTTFGILAFLLHMIYFDFQNRKTDKKNATRKKIKFLLDNWSPAELLLSIKYRSRNSLTNSSSIIWRRNILPQISIMQFSAGSFLIWLINQEHKELCKIM